MIEYPEYHSWKEHFKIVKRNTGYQIRRLDNDEIMTFRHNEEEAVNAAKELTKKIEGEIEKILLG